MSSPNYAITQQFKGRFQAALTSIKSALAEQGFGVLTEIDVKQTLKKKLNIDYPNYYILGVCNPSNAYKALQAEMEIGLLLPCNVIVFEKDNNIYISAIKPTTALTLSQNPALKEIAKTVENKLEEAINKATN